MNSRQEQASPTANPSRKRCPVCHQTVYSPAGIHPQCAMLQADPPKPRAKKPPGAEPAAAVAETAKD